jgi:hypothetical protein
MRVERVPFFHLDFQKGQPPTSSKIELEPAVVCLTSAAVTRWSCAGSAMAMIGSKRERQGTSCLMRPALAEPLQLGRDGLCLRMRVTHQHPGIAMSTDGRNF